MASGISTPHDKLFKQILGEPENAASFLAGNLDRDLVAHLDLASLQTIQTSFIDAQFAQSEADLVFSVTLTGGRPGFVYFLFEHQSRPDAFMLLRLLSYMVRVWQRFHHEHPDAERVPVIVPMVLFHGERPWRGPLSFSALVDLPAPAFSRHVPEFLARVFDLSPFAADRLVGNALVRIVGDLLGAHGHPDFQHQIQRALETLNELGQAPGFARYLEICFRYILQVFDLPKETLAPLVLGAIRQDVKEFLMTTYEQLIQEGMEKGLQQGRQQGLQEGMQEGAAKVLIRLIAKKFRTDPDALLPLLGRIRPEQHEELVERVLEAQSLEEILSWLESATVH